MKILLLCSSWSQHTCGTRIYSRYANFFAERGHAVTLFFPTRFAFEDSIHPDVVVKSPPRWISGMKGPATYNPFVLFLLVAHVLRNRYDIIHVCPGHRPSFFIPALLSKKMKGSVLVDEWWEWFGKEGLGAKAGGVLKKTFALFEDWLELRTKRFYDVIFPITKTLRKRLPKDVQPRAVVLHGGVDEGLVAHEKQFAREQVGLPADQFIIGMCGLCIDDHSDNVPFFRAFCRQAERNSALKLLVSGQKKYLETRFRDEVPDEYSIETGWQTYEKYNLYLSSCDVLVLPLADDPRNRGRWPNKIGDFIRLKRRVITCPVGDLEGLFQENDELGWCVKNDENAYYAVLSKILNMSGSDLCGLQDTSVDGVMTVAEREVFILEAYKAVRGGAWSSDV